MFQKLNFYWFNLNSSENHVVNVAVMLKNVVNYMIQERLKYLFYNYL